MNVVKLKLSDIEKIDIINISGGINANKVKSTYNPDAFMNLALYDMDTRQNITNLVDENIAYGYLFSENGIGIKNDKELVWCSFDLAKSDNIISDYVSGSPILVEDYKKSLQWGNKVSTQIQGKHIRSAFGYNDEYLIMATSETSITLDTLASEMIKLGCKYAVNCDGGGSSHLQINDTKYSTSSRDNPSWLIVRLKKDEVVVNKQYKIIANVLNIRSGAGTNYPIVGTYKLNDVVFVSSIISGFAKTELGYISSKYITEHLSEQSDTKLFNQNDYANIPYPSSELPNATVKSGGCGLCCSANVLKYFGERVDIKSLADVFVSSKIRVNGGTDMEKASTYIKDKTGCELVKTNSEDELVSYLKNGAIAIANVDGVNDIFSTEGHYINVIGATDDKFIVFDVGYYAGKYDSSYRKKYVTLGEKDENVVQYCDFSTLNLDTSKRNPNYYIFYKKEDSNNLGDISEWAKDACSKAVNGKIINGDGNGNYGWKDNVTLEKLIVILDNLKLIK